MTALRNILMISFQKKQKTEETETSENAPPEEKRRSSILKVFYQNFNNNIVLDVLSSSYKELNFDTTIHKNPPRRLYASLVHRSKLLNLRIIIKNN